MGTTKTAVYKQPKLTFKTVWAGIYGGHYDAIVFFKKKPKLSKGKENFLTHELKYYDMVDNKHLTCGAMWLGDFEELYPTVDIKEYYESRETEIVQVFKLKLQAAWDKYGELNTINLRADGY